MTTRRERAIVLLNRVADQILGEGSEPGSGLDVIEQALREEAAVALEDHATTNYRITGPTAINMVARAARIRAGEEE